MQELARAVLVAANGKDGSLMALEQAGKDWAEFALGNFRGKLLKKAIGISIAISEFEFELQQKQQEEK